MSTTPSATNQEPAVRYIESPVEHTLIIDRPEREEMINIAVDHWGAHHTVTISVFDMLDPEQPELREQIIFPYADARLLRDLLNRPEIVSIIDQD